jgi:hypothetical protein
MFINNCLEELNKHQLLISAYDVNFLGENISYKRNTET